MSMICPNCSHEFDRELAPGLREACPRCMAEFLMGETGDWERVDVGRGGAEDKPPLQPGDTLRGMEILELLGRGGMGYVFKARQPNLDRIVAIKTLDPLLAPSPEFASRFHREAKALAALSHPNIVQVYDYGQVGDLYFLVMEFVGGASLRQVLSTERMAPKTALRYVPQICDALEYAHSQGVIHRDIKPENLLIDRLGQLKIADFGLAKIVSTDSAQHSHPTASGRIMGTPHYMAPEQINHMAEVDHRGDIYSLGVVFYEMLTGDLPLGRFSLPSQRAQVGMQVDKVVLKALEQDPQERYQRASEVKSDLAAPDLTAPDLTAPDPRDDERETQSASVSREARPRALARPVWPVGILGGAALIFLATFLPWGAFSGSPTFTGSTGGPIHDLMGTNGPFGGMRVMFTVTGWKGTLSLGGLTMPNWVPFLASLVLAILTLLYRTESAPSFRPLRFALAAYGIAHAGLFVLIIGAKGQVGPGSLLTLGAFLAILVLLIREWQIDASKPATASQS